MKLGIVADVHGNIEGLRAALELMGPVDELVCAGDAVCQVRFSNEGMAVLGAGGRSRRGGGVCDFVASGGGGLPTRGAGGRRGRPDLQRDLVDYMAGRAYQ